MESKTKSAPELKAKITPEQVKEQIANDKKVPNSEKAAKKTSPPATAEKKPKNAEKKDAPFPANIRINDYGFIGLKKGLLEALNWHKGMALKIDKNPDGSVTLRKA